MAGEKGRKMVKSADRVRGDSHHEKNVGKGGGHQEVRDSSRIPPRNPSVNKHKQKRPR